MMTDGFKTGPDGIERDASGRDRNGAANCQGCGYAFLGPICENPACPEGKDSATAEVIRTRAEEWKARREREDAEQALREKGRALAFTPGAFRRHVAGKRP